MKAQPNLPVNTKKEKKEKEIEKEKEKPIKEIDTSQQESNGAKLLNKSMNDFIQKANEAALVPNAPTKPVELKSNNISFSSDVKTFQAVEVNVGISKRYLFYALWIFAVCCHI